VAEETASVTGPLLQDNDKNTRKNIRIIKEKLLAIDLIIIFFI